MQELVNVDIEDVYPYEDADGNSLNPRDFSAPASAEYIRQLAGQFRYNRLNPGQPRVKPILYRDGGIYWIIDGECRYRAMKSIGTKRFLAEVYDDLADAETARAEAAKAMVETDCKLNLTAEEMSRGVQQMLALDLPDEEVAAVARIEPEKVRRARRGARKVADAAYDMTLDRLMAIAEFEGDEEAAAELRDCPQRDWQQVYARLVRERERAALEAELSRALEEAGVPRVPEGDETERVCLASIYVSDTAPAKLEAELADDEPDAYDIDGNWLELLRETTDEDRAEAEQKREEREEERRRDQRAMELWDAELRSMDAWLAERLAEPRTMRRTAAWLVRLVRDSISGTLERLGAEVDMSPSAALCAVGWARAWRPDPGTARALARGTVNSWQVYGDNAAACVGLADAMEADGYEFGETGQAVLETLRNKAEENEKEAEENDD